MIHLWHTWVLDHKDEYPSFLDKMAAISKGFKLDALESWQTAGCAVYVFKCAYCPAQKIKTVEI